MGWHITEALLKTGKHVVKIISRPNSTNKLPDGAEVVRVNYNSDDNTELVEALKGQQALIITMSVTAPSDTISKLVQAAAEADVPYVLPNWYGHDPADEKMCDDILFTPFKTRIIAEFESLGASSYIMLACGFWYEFGLGGGADRYGFDFKKRSLTLFDGGNAAISTSTWSRCANAIANLLSLKELPDDQDDHSVTLSQFRNGPVYISSFELTQRDMFESVKRVTGTTDADWTITDESSEKRWKSARDALLNHGDSHAFAKMLYSRTFFPNGGGDIKANRTLHNDVLGLEKEDLDKFTAVAVSMGEDSKPVIHRSADIYGDVFNTK
jgi:NAD(P)H-binding